MVDIRNIKIQRVLYCLDPISLSGSDEDADLLTNPAFVDAGLHDHGYAGISQVVWLGLFGFVLGLCSCRMMSAKKQDHRKTIEKDEIGNFLDDIVHWTTGRRYNKEKYNIINFGYES